uniref:Uncharacterized protein n=1 Tax=Anguilla anguilla TaxID=7936 RepID=A0A0E9V015_ANGAN
MQAVPFMTSASASCMAPSSGGSSSSSSSSHFCKSQKRPWFKLRPDFITTVLRGQAGSSPNYKTI